MKKKNPTVDKYPQLLNEWDYNKNSQIPIRPDSVTVGSDKKVWGICAEGHSWQATISSRYAGNGCPYCANQKVWPGYNDLESLHPDLAKEWNYEKNVDVNPKQVVAGSNKKVWWKCKNGHSWQAAPSTRIKGAGCPYCSNQKILKGYNDFESQLPELAKEWNYEKNAGLKPDQVTRKSGKRVWWKCKYCGNEWMSSVYDRVKTQKCPACSTSNTSLAEQIVYYYVRQAFPSAISRDQHLGFELDIFIPEEKVGIEYDGVYYHSDHKKGVSDLDKNKLCKENNVKLYRIREVGLDDIPGSICILRKSNYSYSDLEESIERLLTALKAPIDIDINRDLNHVLEKYYVILEDASIGRMAPELMKEWDADKNKVNPFRVPANSSMQVWWKCENGHEWSTSVKSRFSRGTGCPYCAGQKPIVGISDLPTTNPELLVEWDYDKNSIDPKSVMGGSGKKVWWKCSNCGNEWQAPIYNRTKGVGCPKCANKERNNNAIRKRIANGEETFADRFPELVKEWAKDNVDKPDEVMPFSSKKVWWICNKGHKWENSIRQRSRGRGCPYCANKKVLRGFNDLESTNSLLTKQWNTERNGELKPSDVLPYTNRKVWWTCDKGHEWEASVNSRSSGRGCPYCANKRVFPGYNDLATTDPELAKQWHPQKNKDIEPTQVTRDSGTKVWWICEYGHEWQSSVANRTKGKGCPYCAKNRKCSKE